MAVLAIGVEFIMAGLDSNHLCRFRKGPRFTFPSGIVWTTSVYIIRVFDIESVFKLFGFIQIELLVSLELKEK